MPFKVGTRPFVGAWPVVFCCLHIKEGSSNFASIDLGRPCEGERDARSKAHSMPDNQPVHVRPANPVVRVLLSMPGDPELTGTL